jgi:hypothetical protein
VAIGAALAEGLANAVLVVHVAVVSFVVVGLALAIAGNLLGWRWVNNFWFRIAHLAAILVVAAEAWLGLVCPLTTLEMWLRSQAGVKTYAGGFVEHWLQRLLYYNAPPWVFVLGYSAFACVVLATWWYFPPRSRHRVRERVI